MNDIITVRGIVATSPKHIITSGGLSVTSFRLATTARRYDRASATWSDGDTNWFTVTAFRALAANIDGSLSKGDRVVVLGRLRIRNWERDGRSGVAIEIDAETIGHDMVFGAATFNRIPQHIAEGAGPADPGSPLEELAQAGTVDPRTGEVDPGSSDALHDHDDDDHDDELDDLGEHDDPEADLPTYAGAGAGADPGWSRQGDPTG